MDKNRHLEVSSQGGKKRSENYHNQADKQNEENTSTSFTKLEDILASIEVNDGI